MDHWRKTCTTLIKGTSRHHPHYHCITQKWSFPLRILLNMNKWVELVTFTVEVPNRKLLIGFSPAVNSVHLDIIIVPFCTRSKYQYLWYLYYVNIDGIYLNLNYVFHLYLVRNFRWSWYYGQTRSSKHRAISRCNAPPKFYDSYGISSTGAFA